MMAGSVQHCVLGVSQPVTMQLVTVPAVMWMALPIFARVSMLE